MFISIKINENFNSHNKKVFLTLVSFKNILKQKNYILLILTIAYFNKI